jgi:acyl-CoA thioester hydrolase
MDFMQLPITHQTVIPESYLDDMGHMNVMWYTSLFGRATGGLFKMLGLTRAYFESNQSGSFALEQHFRYLDEVRAGTHITIRSRLLGRSHKVMHAIHIMTKDDTGAIAATGEFLGAHVDMRIRRTSPFPAVIIAALDDMIAEQSHVEADRRIRPAMKI